MIRTLIRMNVMVNTDQTVLSGQRIDFGIGVADQEAFAAAILPDPETPGDEPALGWVWRDSHVLMTPSDVYPMVLRVHQDVRSQRKIDDGELYVSITSGNELGTGFGVFVAGLIRCLFKLP